MKRIFGWLQDGQYPNCGMIARELEVSVKSAGRDIACMRDEWELPIGYDEERHGFYFTKKVERLPWVPVTEAELFAVCISHKVLELYHGMPFQRPLLAFAKLAQGLDDEERYRLRNDEAAIRAAYQPPHQFNFIHVPSALKVYFWFPRPVPGT